MMNPWHKIQEALTKRGLDGVNLNQIKLGPGVVGRITTMGVAFFVCVAIALSRIDGAYFIAGIVALAAVILLILVFSAIRFANRNPELSLLEGANLVRYQEVRMAARGLPEAPPMPPIPDPQQHRPLSFPGASDE